MDDIAFEGIVSDQEDWMDERVHGGQTIHRRRNDEMLTEAKADGR